MSKYCKCGNEIPPARVAFLQKTNSPLTCFEHSTTQRVKGFQVIGGKTERYIEVVTPDQAALLEKLGKRAGTGVSKGVKMDQSFKPNLFK